MKGEGVRDLNKNATPDGPKWTARSVGSGGEVGDEVH